MPTKRLQSSSPAANHVLTVSELTGLIRSSIESGFPDLFLEGEISNLRTPGSGHIYCTLKDQSSQIRAVLFRSSAIRVRFTLQEGMQVVVRGRVTVYEPRGEYQIVIESVEPKGIGALQLAFEQLKQKLAAEGLFDEKRKKPLPTFPQTVGLVTSLTGAAIHDILTVLQRRWPVLHILIAPVQVQGEGAGAQIADALTSLNEQGAADVIIVGRGGGSMEDLWSFNEEIVVRAIVASRIPVVSAVGHEIDLTLADFAADHRAPTPSAAAEMVVPVLTDVLDRLSEMTNRIGQVMARYCVAEQRRLDSNIRGLAQIRFRIQEESQRTDEMIVHLKTLLRRQLVEGWERVRERQRELAGLNPVLIVKSNLTMIRQFVKRLERQISVLTEGRRMQIESAMAQLNSLSPLAILGRGYSILTKVQDGTLLRRALDVRVGDDIVARLSEGQLKCTVKRVLPDPSV